jgi:low affinity Fe/Cu permease
VSRFNSWLAEKITDGVGTMWCAYGFAALAAVGFPGFHDVKALVGWVSSYFLQLTLLSIVLVSQNLQANKTDQLHGKVDELHEHVRKVHAEHIGLHRKLDSVVDAVGATGKETP